MKSECRWLFLLALLVFGSVFFSFGASRGWGKAAKCKERCTLMHCASFGEGKKAHHYIYNPPCIDFWQATGGIDPPVDCVRGIWSFKYEATGSIVCRSKSADGQSARCKKVPRAIRRNTICCIDCIPGGIDVSSNTLQLAP